jgi:protein-disulfide isomerase
MNEQLSEQLSDEQEKGALTKKERKLQRREERAKTREREGKRRRMTKVITWAVVFAGLLLTVGAVSYRSQGEGRDMAFSDDPDIIRETDWVRGNREASVVLVEYADFQCPACVRYSAIVKQLSSEYGERVGFVFRHFPLGSIHQNAELAAKAAESAGLQGKFWEMHDLLFEQQDEWSSASDFKGMLENYSRELGLDVDRFMQDLELSSISAKVDNHYREAISLKINSTPTFFLDGRKLESIRSYEQFRSVIEEALGSGT